jgi:hypothetical protein
VRRSRRSPVSAGRTSDSAAERLIRSLPGAFDARPSRARGTHDRAPLGGVGSRCKGAAVRRFGEDFRRCPMRGPDGSVGDL